MPPNFFSISFGLAGLAGVWQLATVLYGASAVVAAALYALAAAVYLVLVTAFLIKLATDYGRVISELKHPILAAFYSLMPISGMLLSLSLVPYAPGVARAPFLIFFALTVLFGGWLTVQRIVGKLDLDVLQPGYFLPTAAGGSSGLRLPWPTTFED